MEKGSVKLGARRLRRPVVSDEDGTREGGLAFSIAFIMAFIAASAAHPQALSSFWVWFVMISMAISVAVGVQRAMAHFNGFKDPNADEDDDENGGVHG